MNIYINKKIRKGDMMEKTNDRWYELMYNTKLDKLVLKKISFFKKIKRRMKEHKVISTIIVTVLIFSILNITMIFSFFNILQKI